MKKYTTLSFALLLIFTSIIFVACKKDLSRENELIPDTNAPDLTTKINTSVSGFVTDENNVPVANAAVSAGVKTMVTDQYGYFSIRNVMLIKNAAVVTVEKNGYFKGIKTWTASTDHNGFFRIKLLPKTTAGSISGSAGGTVTVAGGVTISFPASAFVFASSGAAYTGLVTVKAQWLDPTANDLSSTMPGNLQGLNAAGEMKLLRTFGMTGAELYGSGNELLQIAPGKKATLTMPIPATLNAAAPATIPLWYFDESNGLWKEEGSAVKTGNTYAGYVSHFSFWNCDYPNTYVQFNCTLHDPSGNPLRYFLVRISYASNPNIAGFGWTDSLGYVSGLVPGNTQMQLEVINTYPCYSTIYSQAFTTTTNSISLGVITLPVSSNIVTVTGSVTNCTGNPAYPGHALLFGGDYWRYVPLNPDGTYSFSFSSCTLPVTGQMIGLDETSGQESQIQPVTFVPGVTAVPPMQACGISSSEFFNFTLNSNSYSFITPPVNSVYLFQNNGAANSLLLRGYTITNNQYHPAELRFKSPGIGAGTDQELLEFHVWDHPDSLLIVTPINVHITEYGTTGQFVAGTFTGVFSNYPTPAVNNLTGSFRVRRNF